MKSKSFKTPGRILDDVKSTNETVFPYIGRLYGLVSEFLAIDPEVPGSIPGATGFSDN
jgi:hypothetical protein